MKKLIQFQLRLSPEFHKRLAEEAAKEKRSLHSQILILLERSLSQETAPRKK